MLLSQMQTALHAWQEPVFALAGFIAGLFGTLLGLGGGWFMVPVMAAVGLEAMPSVGSSLAAMVVTTGIGVVKYLRRGLLDLRLGLAFGLPAVVGVTVGKKALTQLTKLGAADYAIGAFYVGLLLLLGASMLRPRAKGEPQASGPRRAWRLPAFGPRLPLSTGGSIVLGHAALAGILAGCLSGLLGIGGGIVLVPIMTGIFGMPVVVAVATSLVSVLTSASYGAVTYALAGAWYPKASLWLAVGAVGGGYLGASLAPYAQERTLRRLFAALALVTAGSIVVKLLGRPQISTALLFGGASLLGVAALSSLARDFVQGRRREKAGVV